jgi:hypothetical protein
MLLTVATFFAFLIAIYQLGARRTAVFAGFTAFFVITWAIAIIFGLLFDAIFFSSRFMALFEPLNTPPGEPNHIFFLPLSNIIKDSKSLGVLFMLPLTFALDMLWLSLFIAVRAVFVVPAPFTAILIICWVMMFIYVVGNRQPIMGLLGLYLPSELSTEPVKKLTPEEEEAKLLEEGYVWRPLGFGHGGLTKLVNGKLYELPRDDNPFPFDKDFHKERGYR